MSDAGQTPTINALAQHLAQFAPLSLAEPWDNVGLLVGDRSRSVQRLMTCLTITPAVVAEAIRRQAQLIVAHHPLPFQPLKRITADTTAGGMLIELIAAGVAVYSAHTAMDSAAGGINQQWAEGLQLEQIRPLQPVESADPNDALLGAGRIGSPPAGETLANLARRAQTAVAAATVRVVGQAEQNVSKVAIACGSGGSFLGSASRRGCDALITGEANFHACLEAQATGVGLILVGHFASERFAMERLAQQIGEQFPELDVWASEADSDPLWTL